MTRKILVVLSLLWTIGGNIEAQYLQPNWITVQERQHPFEDQERCNDWAAEASLWLHIPPLMSRAVFVNYCRGQHFETERNQARQRLEDVAKNEVAEVAHAILPEWFRIPDWIKALIPEGLKSKFDANTNHAAVRVEYRF